MKSFSNFSTLVLVLFLFGAAVAAAQTPQTSDSGTLTLEGTVPKIVTINVSPKSVASNLDLSTDQTDLLVATVTETSNVRAGYSVTVQSANAASQSTTDPFFASTSGGNSDTLSYTLKYDGDTVSFTGGSAATVTDASDKTAVGGSTHEVRISYTGTTKNLYADSYQDTLTFTITAK